MGSDDQREQTIEDGDAVDARPACVALVPMVPSVEWSQTTHSPLSRPDPTFVTHLIATAAHAPQTRTLRRATLADAQTAYQSATVPPYAKAAGGQMRQVA